jgi:tRNA-binding EMAP/Myf-like protein
MKLSLDWINDYIDISDIDPEELAHKLTMTTTKVKEVITVKRLLDKIVVAEVISVNTISIAGGISEVIVDCGDHTIRTITAIKDLKPGMKAAFAHLGSVLNGKRFIQLKEIAGAESRGKLCSPHDLCLGEVDDEALELPLSIENGTPLTHLIPETDTLLDIDSHALTHRPDLWEHQGFAREISSILNRPLKSLTLQKRTLQIPEEFFSRRMGTKITINEIKRHLNSIGFGATRKNGMVHVTFPSFKSHLDTSIPEDILEEVARLHGHDAINPVLPSVPMESIAKDSYLKMEQAIKQVLSFQNEFQEIQTYNWFIGEFLPIIDYHSPDSIRLINPVSPGLVLLRDSLLPNLLSVMQMNKGVHDHPGFYEMGRRFTRGIESRSIAAVCCQIRNIEVETQLLNLKRVAGNMFKKMDLAPPIFLPREKSESCNAWHEGELGIWAGEKQVGVMGNLPSEIGNRLIENSLITWFELDLDKINVLEKGERQTQLPSKLPGSCLDLSVLFPRETPYNEIGAKPDLSKHASP